MLLDVTPSRVSNLVASQTTLYVGAYDFPLSQIPTNGRIVAVDLTTDATIGAPLAMVGALCANVA